MKKTTILFLAFLMLFSANIFAVDYNLKVTGAWITDENKDDIAAAININGCGTATGIITYDPTTNTLTLDNATLNLTNDDGIYNEIENLTINLIGENTITTSNYAIYSDEADLTITGSGSLTINAGYSGIFFIDCNLTIENTTVTVISNDYGICGLDGSTEVLTINNSVVKATGTNEGSICNIKSLNLLNYSKITQPTAAWFVHIQHAVCLGFTTVAATVVTTEVIIEPAYDLRIAGVQVTIANKNNITAALVAAGKDASGTITYDPTTSILTLDNASINATADDDGIFIDEESLTIELIGENYITAEWGIIFDYVDEGSRITGPGSLTINADYAICYWSCNLTIENTSVTTIGTNFGILGYNDNNEVLIITNSTVKATGTNNASIQGMYNLILNGCAITQPSDAYFDTEQYAVVDANGEIVKTEVVIEPGNVPAYHDLYIAGVQVTDENKDDIAAAINISGYGTATGIITYDPTTNTLTLNNASINATTDDGINNGIFNLTINLVGENTITADDDGIESRVVNLKITGTGSLTINAETYGIYCYDVYNLTIENTTVTAIGERGGIRGFIEFIIITNSTVKATGTNDGSIAYMYNLVLNGCAIAQPEGAYFDDGQIAVCVNGNIVKTEVIIAPFPTISVSDHEQCDGIYTLPTSENSDTWTWTNESNETVTEATESGVYTVVATSEFNLTATESITVTINQSVTNEITEVACGSFEWNGTTYTETGDYSETFTAENGCDSIVTLHLTINEIVTNEITEVACGSFEWNGITYDASGDYSETFTAENGCDSIVTLHLTINQSVTNEITEVACGSFEWNGTTYDASGDYTETFTAENGCDSVVTLHLTINELPNVEITQEGEILTASAGMETYAWNTNETTESITISATGNYSVTVTNAEGCENTADIEVTEIPTTGINEIAVSKIAVYPNPNNGEFTINLSGIDNAISYQVIDTKGAIVKEAKVNSNEEFVSIQAKAGNYTVKVISDSKVFVEQIIVQ